MLHYATDGSLAACLEETPQSKQPSSYLRSLEINNNLWELSGRYLERSSMEDI